MQWLYALYISYRGLQAKYTNTRQQATYAYLPIHTFLFFYAYTIWKAPKVPKLFYGVYLR